LNRLRFLLPLVLLLGALVAPAPTAAILPPGDGGTTYFPGRMLRDDQVLGTDHCRVAAYGRVNGAVVIFIANHCGPTGGAYEGLVARTNSNIRIGVYGKRELGWTNNDLAYIILDAAWVPSVASGMRNKIYRGDVSGSDYWTMTTQPTVGDGCSAFASSKNVYENWQRYFGTDTAYRTGQTLGAGPDGCGTDGGNIQTNLDWHGGVCCTSGTPVVAQRDTTTLTGMITGQVGGLMYFETFAEGLADLDAYWDTHGNWSGAKLCVDADC
jgi:hypothetical protein